MKAKYKIVADILEKEISEGVYNENEKIPTEEELGKRFEVSRNTVRKAIECLVQKGCVYQVQGSGIFLRKSIDNDNINTINIQKMNGVTNDFKNKKIETQIIEFKLIKADKNISNKMNCKIGTPIYYVNRLRLIDKNPDIMEYSYFNKELILHLNENIVKGSIYDYIRDNLKLSIGLIDRIFYGDYLTDKDRKYLRLEKKAPALICENMARLSNGEIFNYSKSVHNYKNIRFSFLANLR